MSMFLTPDGRPFFGGTYFPPRDRDGTPASTACSSAVADAWRDQRAELEKDADSLTDAVRSGSAGRSTPRRGSRSTRDLAARRLARRWPSSSTPSSAASASTPTGPKRPKFPEPVEPRLPPRPAPPRPADGRAGAGARPAGDGPQDARPRWPAAASATTWPAAITATARTATGASPTSRRCSTTTPSSPRSTCWPSRRPATPAGGPRPRRPSPSSPGRMTAPEGGFYSALDAETEGEEGKSYVWTRDEVETVLGDGEDFAVFAQVYGLDGEPNFEGGPLRPARAAAAEQAEALDRRPRPSKPGWPRSARSSWPPATAGPRRCCDDKVLTSWNGLMIAAYADGFRVLKDDRYRQRRRDGRRLPPGASCRTPTAASCGPTAAARPSSPAYLEDYAFLAHGLLRLHAATGDPKRLAQARALADRMIADFADPEDGGFFYTAGDHESLLARAKDPFDNALPGGNSVAIRDLVALGVATGEAATSTRPARPSTPSAPSLARNPAGLPPDARGPRRIPRRPPRAPRLAGRRRGRADPAGSVVTAKADRRQGRPWPRRAASSRSPSTLTIRGRLPHLRQPAPCRGRDPDGRHPRADGQRLRPRRVDYPDGDVEDPRRRRAGEGRRLRGDSHPHGARLASRGPTRQSRSDVPASRYQACNDRACLAPATLEVPVPVEVRGRRWRSDRRAFSTRRRLPTARPSPRPRLRPHSGRTIPGSRHRWIDPGRSRPALRPPEPEQADRRDLARRGRPRRAAASRGSRSATPGRSTRWRRACWSSASARRRG